MSVLGWFLAVAGLVGLVFALRMMLKMKKMQTVPFVPPSDIEKFGASKADAKGMISTEGVAEIGPEPLIAPMSGQPCIAYELVIERKYEEEEETENGTKTKSGSEKMFTEYKGAQFRITDAAGGVDVDASKQPDADFEKSHDSKIKVGVKIPGVLGFGQFEFNTPSMRDKDGRTIAFVGTEKVLKAGSNMYAVGALENNIIGEPKGLTTGKLILSNKGRAKLMASTKRNMILGYSIGGVLAAGGTALGVFGPAPAPSSGGVASCSSFTNVTNCNGRMYSADGDDLTWTVPKADRYRLTVKQPKVKNPIDATLTVYDSTGKQVAYNDGGAAGADAVVTALFQPGTYRINVRDFTKHKVKGGYGYSLDVASLTQPVAAPSLAAAAVGGAAAAPVGGALGAAPPAAGAPIATTSPTCEQVAVCCEAINGDASACSAFLKAPEAACAKSLKSFQKAAKRVKKARAFCMTPKASKKRGRMHAKR